MTTEDQQSDPLSKKASPKEIGHDMAPGLFITLTCLKVRHKRCTGISDTRWSKTEIFIRKSTFDRMHTQVKIGIVFSICVHLSHVTETNVSYNCDYKTDMSPYTCRKCYDPYTEFKEWLISYFNMSSPRLLLDDSFNMACRSSFSSLFLFFHDNKSLSCKIAMR